MFKFKSNHYKKCNQHCLAKQKEASVQFSSVQSLSRVQLFATPWTAARQACQSIINSRSLLKFMSVESVMPSNHLILCHPLLLPPSIFPSIRVFSNESALHIRWPKYWSFSFSWFISIPLILLLIFKTLIFFFFFLFFLFFFFLVKWSSGSGEGTKKSVTGCDQLIVNTTALGPAKNSHIF